MSTTHRLPGRTWTLIAGDTLALLVFSALGRAEHKLDVTLSGTVGTTLPFLIVWLAVGMWFHVFKPETVSSPVAALRGVIAPWFVTLPWALLLRSFILDGLGGTVHVVFALVTFFGAYVFLAGWRAAYAFALKRVGQGNP